MNGFSTLRENGLTLIELLVVIGIIVTLGTISLPAINAARVKANQVKCANNMRQIGVAMISYAFDREGWLPTSTHGAAMQNSWIFLLQNYVGGGFDEIRICPADPKGQARRAAGGNQLCPQ
ncbi:type II secretion system protein [Kamptonema cortianum]|nr:type II secretion system protein [Kamptonema cortianum]